MQNNLFEISSRAQTRPAILDRYIIIVEKELQEAPVMIQIDIQACIGCGRCAWDCFPGALVMENGTPVLQWPDRCLGCGHCIAICPKNAVSDDTLHMTQVREIIPQKDPDALMHLIQSRRSCRHFKNIPITEDQQTMLLNAARFCPTAKNLQATRYIAVTESIPALLDAALAGLGAVGQAQIKTATDPNELRRAENFIRWAKLRQQDKTFDPLFFHAPLLLMFVAKEDPRDAAAAAAYAELMAAAMGLGCLYSGYFTACAEASPEIRKLLKLSPDEAVVRCLVLGHPDVKFHRTVPRRPANLTRL